MKDELLAWIYGLFIQCHHSKPSEKTAVYYCLGLSCVFVGSLYALVPPNIRRMDRDNNLHIQWRSLATFAVCGGAVFTYPLFFCDLNGTATWAMPDVLQPRHVQGILFHTWIIYLGPTIGSILWVHDYRRRTIARGKPLEHGFIAEIFHSLLKPSIASFLNPLTEEERWKNIRNYIVAPVTEEIVFRGCMVPALLAAGMSPLKASLVAPLFFGVAHAHHAIVRLRQGEAFSIILFGTIFQFAYTTLFGSYAAYAFIRTGSVGAVVVSHAYCNWMGLPDLSFMNARSPLYRYRMFLVVMYIAGALAFKWFLTSDMLLPLPSVLPNLFLTEKLANHVGPPSSQQVYDMIE
jgi:membrane protease YdiL (CAAX protease family)